MAKFNVCTIRPKGFLHSSAFAELKDSLCWSLSALGHDVMSTENAFATSPATNILFGTELLTPTSAIPPDAIILNCEQPSHPAIENVRKLAAGHVVWDIYKGNVADWLALGIDARHLPVGYTPNLTRIPKAPIQDIDVAFFGWMTERRRKLLADLRAAGLNVYASDSCYGGARDQILSRTKVCLNVHHDGRDLFEIVRVSYLLANSKCVVSEISSDDDDYPWLKGRIVRSPYEDIVNYCQTLVSNEGSRVAHEEAAVEFMKQSFTVFSVAKVLDGAPRSGPRAGRSPSAIQQRYDRGLREGDMKDFLPLLRGLAKGNILEIGVRDGASTSAFLLGLEERGGHLISIDIADCSTLWQHAQWSFVHASSREYMAAKHTFDLAFIDGDHSPEGFMSDLHGAMEWVRPGGLILCHDISPLPNFTREAAGGDWPSQYVGEQFFSYCREHKLRHFVYPGAWGLGVIVKDPQ